MSSSRGTSKSKSQEEEEKETGEKYDARILYRRIQELEKELKITSKKRNVFDKSVFLIRTNLRNAYERLLFIDYDFSCSKEVEQNLWKNVFYRVIEEYRKRIRKLLAESSNVMSRNTANSMNSLPSITLRKTEMISSSHNTTFSSASDPIETIAKEGDMGETNELISLCESFRVFLSKASKFYSDLIIKLKNSFRLKLDGSMDYPLLEAKSSSVSEEEIKERIQLNAAHKGILSCHRCLIFLGDLARYHRDLAGHKSQNDWTKAAGYYHQALYLVPDNGNPHNQLAVFATYQDDDFDAVYHYFLGLAVLEPFLTARDNLLVLFEKNRLRLADRHMNGDLSLKSFLIRFVRLHGLLYTRVSLESFESLQRSVIVQLDQLLRQGEINNEILSKIMVINIFSMINARVADELGVTGHITSNVCSIGIGGDREIHWPSQVSIALTYAMALSFQCFGVVLKYASTRNLKHLGPLCIFLDFLYCHQEFLRQSSIRESNVWKEVSKLISILPATSSESSLSLPASSLSPPILREEIELRGFLPLQALYRKLPFSSKLLSSLSEEEEENTKRKRISKLRAFSVEMSYLLPLKGPAEQIPSSSQKPRSITKYERKGHAAPVASALSQVQMIAENTSRPLLPSVHAPTNTFIPVAITSSNSMITVAPAISTTNEMVSNETVSSIPSVYPTSNPSVQIPREQPTTFTTSSSSIESMVTMTTATTTTTTKAEAMGVSEKESRKPRNMALTVDKEDSLEPDVILNGGNMDILEDEVILFRPGDGDKLESTEMGRESSLGGSGTGHHPAAIGTGRALEPKTRQMSGAPNKESGGEYSELERSYPLGTFDLFGESSLYRADKDPALQLRGTYDQKRDLVSASPSLFSGRFESHLLGSNQGSTLVTYEDLPNSLTLGHSNLRQDSNQNSDLYDPHLPPMLPFLYSSSDHLENVSSNSFDSFSNRMPTITSTASFGPEFPTLGGGWLPSMGLSSHENSQYYSNNPNQDAFHASSSSFSLSNLQNVPPFSQQPAPQQQATRPQTSWGTFTNNDRYSFVP